MLIKKVSIFLIGFYFFTCISAQGLGLNPQNIDWNVITIGETNIIYDKQVELKAQRIAAMIEFMDENNRRSIGEKEKGFDLVLRHYTAIPNGYVNLAPFRSEYFLTPPESPFLGTVQWYELLAIHEYRHNLQFMNGNKGISRVGSFLFGENGQLLLNFMAVPNWFFEGDAVISETALTGAGRGRTPSFTQGMRTLVYEDRKYSYGKIRNGSFKDFVPNHYPYGYMMLSHIRNTRGNDVTKDIFADAVSYEGVIYPFSRSMKKRTGLGTRGMYKEAIRTYGQEWLAMQERIETTPAARLTEEKTRVISYRFPKTNESGDLYAVRTSFKKTAEITKVELDGETKVVAIGRSLNSYYDIHEEDFVWAEFTNDSRRVNLEYSDIVYFSEGKKYRITNKKRYFSPSFSEEGTSVFVTEIAENGHSKLVKLSLGSGKVQSSHDFGNTSHLMRPVVISDNEIAYIIQSNSLLWLEKINWETGEKTKLTEKTEHVMDGLSYRDGYLYFSASFSGVENIYRTETTRQTDIQQLTSVKIAAATPFLDAKGDLYYTEFSSRGRYISRTSIDMLSRSIKNIRIEKPVDMSWMDNIAETAEGGSILDKIESKEYESTPYKGFFKGLSLHSYLINPLPDAYSFTVYMNNALDDKQLVVGVSKLVSLNEIGASADLRIGKFYPVIDMGFDTRRLAQSIDGDIETLREFAPGLNVFVPLSKNLGLYTYSSQVGLDSRYKIQREIKLNSNDIENRSFFSGELSAAGSFRRINAVQNMRSRFGGDLTISYGLGLIGDGESQLNAEGRLFLPGVLKNHSLLVSGGFQQLSVTRNLFVNSFDFPRGYLQRGIGIQDQIRKFEIEYAFPLLYPDLDIAGIVYFKRIKANLFWENARIGRDQPRTFRSTGFEILFDNTYFNIAPITLGFYIGTSKFQNRTNFILGPQAVFVL